MFTGREVNSELNNLAVKLTIRGREESIKSLGKHIKDKGVGGLSFPLELFETLEQSLVVCQVWYCGEELSPDEDVIQSSTHSSTCEGVPHVEGISKQ